MENINKYSFSINDDERYNGEICNSKAEAIHAGIKQAIAYGVKSGTLYVGRVQEFRPSIYAGCVIDQLIEQASTEVGEFAEDYLDFVEKEHIDELSRDLQEVFDKWENKHPEYKPHFYTVCNVNEFDIEKLLKV